MVLGFSLAFAVLILAIGHSLYSMRRRKGETPVNCGCPLDAKSAGPTYDAHCLHNPSKVH
ncbi:MAG: hypothetical protein AAB515_02385 [Patescibacteria group bacterium]